MLLIRCPWCGPRDEIEFRYGGQAHLEYPAEPEALTDAEWAFRITKDELKIRPVWHHLDERIEAHILVCFLAYVMWKTLAQWMKGGKLGDAPRTLLEEIAKITHLAMLRGQPIQLTSGQIDYMVNLYRNEYGQH